MPGRRLSKVSPTFREVWKWLSDEWRRICEDQVARDPLHAPPEALTMPAQMDRVSAHALLHWFSSQRSHLDCRAQAEWVAAYVRASQKVAEMAATSAAMTPLKVNARDA